MRRAEDITFIIGANSKRFRSELNSTHRLLSRFAAALTPVIAGFSLRRIIADLDDIGKKAGRVGLTTDQLQELRFAGEQSGVAINALDIGMQRFARRIAEVASGTNNDLAKVLRANNIALRDQEGNLRDQVDILGDYADLIKRAGNEQDRTRLAFLAFDSEGVALVNTLRDGRQGLEEMRKSARDLGVVIDEDAIAAAERMNDKFNAIFSSLSATFKGFVVNTAEQFETLFQSYDTSTPLDQIEKRIEELRSQRTDISQNGLPLFAGWFDTVERNVSMIDKQIARLRELQRVAERGLDPRQRSFLPDEDDTPTLIPDRKDEEGRRKLAAKAEKQARAIKQVVEALELEYANLSRTQAQQRIYNELKRAGVDINSQAGQQIAELVTAIEAENRALELNRETLEQLEDRQKAVQEGQEYLISSAADVGAAFVEGSENGIEALKRLAIQIVAAAAQAKLLGTGPLAGLFGGSFGAIAGNANLSPGANALARAGRGGLFARGGITNRPAIFGEHGPEAAIPLPDGKTVPVTLNDRNFRQAQPVIHYAPTLNIDARGADMAAVARIERGMDERDRNFRENVLGVLQSASSRNRPVALTA